MNRQSLANSRASVASRPMTSIDSSASGPAVYLVPPHDWSGARRRPAGSMPRSRSDPATWSADGVAAGVPKHSCATAAAPQARTRLASTAPGRPSARAAAASALSQNAVSSSRRAGRVRYGREAHTTAAPVVINTTGKSGVRPWSARAASTNASGTSTADDSAAPTSTATAAATAWVASRRGRRATNAVTSNATAATGVSRYRTFQKGSRPRGRLANRSKAAASMRVTSVAPAAARPTTIAATATATMSLGRRRGRPSATIPNTDEPHPRRRTGVAAGRTRLRCGSVGCVDRTSEVTSRAADGRWAGRGRRRGRRRPGIGGC